MYSFAHKFVMRECRLTKKAEPPPTRDVNRASGTDSANGGWLRRLVRRLKGPDHAMLGQKSSQASEKPISGHTPANTSSTLEATPHRLATA